MKYNDETRRLFRMINLCNPKMTVAEFAYMLNQSKSDK